MEGVYTNRVLQVYLRVKRFFYLIGKNVLQPKVLQNIAEFIEADAKNYTGSIDIEGIKRVCY